MQTDRIHIDIARSRLASANVFDALIEYDPRWVGSIPLDIHGPGADADICCCAGPDLDSFQARLTDAFSKHDGFEVSPNLHAGEASIIARFNLDDLPVEIYGRARPVECHESYIHWLAEDRLLRLAEDRLRLDVTRAKRQGLKTEPAFATCLKLGGEPYAELLKLASPGDEALRSILRLAGYTPR